MNPLLLGSFEVTKPRMKVFLDIDGVLADPVLHAKNLFGWELDYENDDPRIWGLIGMHPGFYRTMPRMPDAMELYEGVKKIDPYPVIITGIPRSVPRAAIDKRHWVTENIDRFAEVICCRSADKRIYGEPGDVLIDDRTKYRHLWEKMGGIYIVHKSAQESLKELERLHATR